MGFMNTNLLLNVSADRIPVTIILLFTVLDFIVFFTVSNSWIVVAFWLLMIIPKGVISAWNHHHQHRHVFKNNGLNRVLEFFYALHTGVTTNLWVLHHNHGHHRNFLDQEKDESRWKRENGKIMGMFAYTMSVVLTAYPRGYKVGKRFPKQQKQFITYGIITFILLMGLIIYNPFNALFIFVLPMIVSITFTAWATFGHHAGLDTQNEFEASHNQTARWFNFLTGNLGYHTAHHYKQGVHWSKLPELHEQIKSKIPDKCFRSSVFERFIKNNSLA